MRRRPEDIPALARDVLDYLDGGGSTEIAPDAMRAMQAYSWPGNLREMRNVFERARLISGGASRITAVDLRFEAIPESEAEVMTLEDVERRHIDHVLRLEAGNVDRAAIRLGVSRSTLYQKLKRYREEVG